MISKFKKVLYFPIASYFRFFATIRLRRWNPKVIVVTGSNGKTTLLHMLESQIGDRAKYSHHANSSFGIPFDILGLQRKSLLKSEWFDLIFKTPMAVLKKLPMEKLYIVEADCDRPGEGKFLASFLNPSIVLWVSTSRTHSINFEKLVKENKFEKVDEAIAYEFGYFIEYAKEAVIVNSDSELMNNQLERTQAEVISIKKDSFLEKYSVGKYGTVFQIEGIEYKFRYLLPEEIFISIRMTEKICKILNISFDQSFSKFILAPGRGSIFKGIKNITIVDSSYNSNFSSAKALISMFAKFGKENKWVVIGDMLELGQDEESEHIKLAEELAKYNFEKIILMGPRVSKYTYPKLHEIDSIKNKIIKFLDPKETLDYLLANINGGEVVLFKGARFMEGIIEHLLENKDELKWLARREKIWEIRRKKWGL